MMNDQGQQNSASVVSGSDAPVDHYESSSSQISDLNYFSDDDGGLENDPEKIKDELYNPNKDEEDEAYVYRHLRGGVEESISIRRKTKKYGTPNRHTEQCAGQVMNERMASSSEGITEDKTDETQKARENNQAITVQNAKVLKPRSSDAVLSCPCCLQIVCMDCQSHERYSNQFRAMFVMNIGVSWDKIIIPEENNVTDSAKEDKKKGRKQMHGFISDTKNYNRDDSLKEIYYSVHCNKCHTEVAALDMRDEVYHFFGCLVSA